MENATPTSPAVTLGPPAEASSLPGVSPGPQTTFPMSPSAEGQDHTSVVPSSSLVPSLANAPGLSVGPPYACQSSLSFDPLQARDPWQSWHSGPGSQRDVTQANPMSQPYRDFSVHSGGGVTAGQSGDGGRSSQDVSGVGGSGQERDATYGLPPNWDWNIPPPHPPQAQGVDPVLAGLTQQQLQLGQTLIDVMRRGNQQQQPQQPQQPPVGVPERERLTMDTKWIPAMPLPSFKQWVSRSRELSGFRDWAEKLGVGWRSFTISMAQS